MRRRVVVGSVCLLAGLVWAASSLEPIEDEPGPDRIRPPHGVCHTNDDCDITDVCRVPGQVVKRELDAARTLSKRPLRPAVCLPDTTAPAVALDPVPALIARTTVDLGITVSDDRWSDRVEVRIDGVVVTGSPLQGATRADLTVPLPGQGTHRLEVRGYDAAGNIGVASVEVEVDSVPPTLCETIEPPLDAIGWSAVPVAVHLVGEDNPGGTGVAAIAYRIDAGPEVVVPGATATLEFPDEGVFDVTAWAVDAAGNRSAEVRTTARWQATFPDLDLGPYPSLLELVVRSTVAQAAALDTRANYAHSAAQGQLLAAIGKLLWASRDYDLGDHDANGQPDRAQLRDVALGEVEELRQAAWQVSEGGPAFGLTPGGQAWAWQSGSVAVGVARMAHVLADEGHPQAAAVADLGWDLLEFWGDAFLPVGDDQGFFEANYAPEWWGMAIHNQSALLATASALLSATEPADPRATHASERAERYARFFAASMEDEEGALFWMYGDDVLSESVHLCIEENVDDPSHPWEAGVDPCRFWYAYRPIRDLSATITVPDARWSPVADESGRFRIESASGNLPDPANTPDNIRDVYGDLLLVTDHPVSENEGLYRVSGGIPSASSLVLTKLSGGPPLHAEASSVGILAPLSRQFLRSEDASHLAPDVDFMETAILGGFWPTPSAATLLSGTVLDRVWSGNPARPHGYLDGRFASPWTQDPRTDWTLAIGASLGVARAAHLAGADPQVFEAARALLYSGILSRRGATPGSDVRTNVFGIAPAVELLVGRPEPFAAGSRWDTPAGPEDAWAEGIRFDPDGDPTRLVSWPSHEGTLPALPWLVPARGPLGTDTMHLRLDLPPGPAARLSLAVTWWGGPATLEARTREGWLVLGDLPETLDGYQEGSEERRWWRTPFELRPDQLHDEAPEEPGITMQLRIRLYGDPEGFAVHRLEATPLFLFEPGRYCAPLPIENLPIE